MHWRTGSLVKSCSIVFLVKRKKQRKEICKFLTIGLEYRPLPSSKNPHFQNEAKCTTFLVKMSFICMRMTNESHSKGWAPILVFKQRPRGTREWPIDMCSLLVCLLFSPGRGGYFKKGIRKRQVISSHVYYLKEWKIVIKFPLKWLVQMGLRKDSKGLFHAFFFFKAETCPRISWIPIIMAQVCFVTVHLGIETVVRRL